MSAQIHRASLWFYVTLASLFSFINLTLLGYLLPLLLDAFLVSLTLFVDINTFPKSVFKI